MGTAQQRTAEYPPAVIGARWIPLTRGLFALVDGRDYAALVQHNWTAARGSSKAKTDLFYAVRTAESRIAARAAGRARPHRVKMHREILGVSDALDVDHENGNGLDNRRHNLRPATRAQNIQNSKKRKDNTSGYRGVWWCSSSKRWRVDVVANGVRHRRNGFTTREKAMKVAQQIRQAVHSKFYNERSI